MRVPAGVGAMAAIMGLSPAVVRMPGSAGGRRICSAAKSEFAVPDGDLRARRAVKRAVELASHGTTRLRDSCGFPLRFIRRIAAARKKLEKT